MDLRREVAGISLQNPGAADRVRPLLSGEMLKRLVDKSYEKRWLAAGELQHVVQGFCETHDLHLISDCIAFFKTEFLDSPSELNKLGGLLAFAAIALGVEGSDDCSPLFGCLLRPVIACFSFDSVAVRFYTAEALHNITKVPMSREHILGVLSELLIPILTLGAGVEANLRQAIYQLDWTLKAIVVETDADERFLSHSQFVETLSEKAKTVRNPQSVQSLVTWLSVLQSIPSFNFLQYLPKFLEALFVLVSQESVQQTVLNALSGFLCEVRARIEDEDVGLQFITRTMAKLCNEGESMVRLRALSWLESLLEVAGQRMICDYPGLLDSVTRCLSDLSPSVVSTSVSVHRRMLSYIQRITDTAPYTRHLACILQVLIRHIEGPAGSNWDMLMSWLETIYRLNAEIMEGCIERVVNVLVKRIAEATETPVEPTLNALCLLSTYSGLFRTVIDLVLGVFRENRAIMEKFGGLILFLLCSNLGSERVYRTMADILIADTDESFSRMMVELLDVLLFTEEPLSDLRDKIRNCFANGSRAEIALFEQLFLTWCINPVSGLNLCFLAQAYELAYELLLILSETKITVEVLVQLARLVQLLDKPLFAQLRVQLLEPEKFPYLLKALYGVLMMLPQSKAYKSLESLLLLAVSCGQSPHPSSLPYTQ